MLNNPAMGAESAPVVLPENQKPSVNVMVSEADQKSIVGICNKFKNSMKQHAKEKKRAMRDAYAYSKSKFIGNDLLPVPESEGSDKDASRNRPQVFVPKTRQQVKTLYAFLKLTLFPNEDDFFRIRAKTNDPLPGGVAFDPTSGMPILGPNGQPKPIPKMRLNEMGQPVPVTYVDLEDEITDGMKHILKEQMFTEKMAPWILNLVQQGNGEVIPKICHEDIHEWQIDPQTQQYKANVTQLPPRPDWEVLDPLHYYQDPKESNPDKAKWGYFSKKKLQEMKDSPYYFNIGPELEKLAQKTVDDTYKEDIRTTDYTDLQSSYDDTEPSVEYDLYYFPCLDVPGGQIYRNMLVGIAANQVLVRFHPSLAPRGMNPLVHCTWMEDTQSPYGIGPVEDMMPLQRLINMVYNHLIETLARIGNCYAVQEGTDLSSMFGAAARVLITKGPPSQEIMPFTGDYAEVASLMNFIGTVAAEAQITSGAQNPFQGSSQVDFKKTATELQILQENGISINREIVEHIAVRVQRILELTMYLCADAMKEPLKIRVDDPMQGPQFKDVDLSPILSGNYTVELVNVNPSQSKQAQVETLTRLVEMIGNAPQMLPVMEPVLNKISTLEGLRDGPEMLQEIIQKVQGMMANAQAQQAIQAQQAGVGAAAEPPMAGAA